jgi:ribosomal protein S18 acetylase RimI-like enzyme
MVKKKHGRASDTVVATATASVEDNEHRSAAPATTDRIAAEAKAREEKDAETEAESSISHLLAQSVSFWDAHLPALSQFSSISTSASLFPAVTRPASNVHLESSKITEASSSGDYEAAEKEEAKGNENEQAISKAHTIRRKLDIENKHGNRLFDARQIPDAASPGGVPTVEVTAADAAAVAVADAATLSAADEVGERVNNHNVNVNGRATIVRQTASDASVSVNTGSDSGPAIQSQAQAIKVSDRVTKTASQEDAKKPLQLRRDVVKLSDIKDSPQGKALINALINFVKLTSHEQYRASVRGWNKANKKDEMELHGMMAVVLSSPSQSNNEEPIIQRSSKKPRLGLASSLPNPEKIVAFATIHPVLLLPEEDPSLHFPSPALYLYELHVHPSHQSLGLGSLLLSSIIAVARAVPGVIRLALTVFERNTKARALYLRRGFADGWKEEDSRRWGDGQGGYFVMVLNTG